MLTSLLAAVCLGLVAAAPSGELDFNVTVLENGMLVQEEVQILPSLQIYHVPKHHDREHVKVYVDYENNHVMTVFLDLNKCQLSQMEVDRPDFYEQARGLETLRDYIPFAGHMEEKELAKIEKPEPLEELSFVRQELRDACENKTVYWTSTIDITNQKEEFFLIPSEAEEERVKRDAEFFQCPILNFNQKCKRKRTTSSGGACYYFVTCAMTNTEKKCMTHILHGSIECRPCCTLPNSPKTGLLLHCDHLVW